MIQQIINNGTINKHPRIDIPVMIITDLLGLVLQELIIHRLLSNSF